MKVQGVSEKAELFLIQNYKLPTSSNGVLIHVIEIEGHLRVMIDVSENTTHNDLRDAIPLALEWRNRLLEYQGPWLWSGENSFLEELHTRHRNGQSYAELAERINQKVTDCLQKYYQYVVAYYKAVQSQFKTLDFPLLKLTPNAFALDYARMLLQFVSLRDEEISEYLQIALERIAAGEQPSDRDYPVSGEKLRETLRSWRQGKKHQIIQAKQKEWRDRHRRK